MEKEKLMNEYKVTLESLVSKTEFVYSEEFYKLDEFDKQKYQRDKMATEAHLSTLCNLLWGEKMPTLSGGLSDIFALSIVSSMFNGGRMGLGSTSGAEYLKAKLDEKDFEEVETENKAE